jgi:transcriptional regulator with XRE-family HTH domain
MIIGKKTKHYMLHGDFTGSRIRVKLTTADMVRIAREKNEFSQNELSRLTKIPQSTISGIEAGRISVGVERAKVLALALNVHPGVLLFPGWKVKSRKAA